MAAEAMDVISNPIIQYGFAGFCVVLLGIMVWLIKQLLQVLKENNKIIASNTEAIQQINNTGKETREEVKEAKLAVYSLRDALLKRPCQIGD